MTPREELDASLFNQGVELVPTIPRIKKPIEGFNLTKHWTQKNTTTADLAYWRSRDYDRAAVLGSVSCNLIALDFDSFTDARRFWDSKLYQLLPSQTFTTITTRGIRYFFKDPQCDFSRFKNAVDMRPQISGEILLHHHLAQLPGNTHPSGSVYELAGTDKILSKPTCVEAFLKALRERFHWTGDPYKTEYSEFTNRASHKRGKFKETEIPGIVEHVLPYWREGYRHKVVYALCGLLISHNATEENAIALINAIFDRTREPDHDRRNALAQVHAHFKHNSNPEKQPRSAYLRKLMLELRQN